MMFAVVAARRTVTPITRCHQQRRGIVDWMTNYPDKVMEMKKIQCAGGTCQGEHNPTWLKQSGDTAVAGFGALLIGAGSLMFIQGIYRLATGKGKKPI